MLTRVLFFVLLVVIIRMSLCQLQWDAFRRFMRLYRAKRSHRLPLMKFAVVRPLQRLAGSQVLRLYLFSSVTKRVFCRGKCDNQVDMI